MNVKTTLSGALERARRRTVCPIGVDVGSQSVKLVQLARDAAAIEEVARWDFSGALSDDPAARRKQVGEAIRRLRVGRKFRGRQAVLCLGAGQLFVQNIRVARLEGDELRRAVLSEAGERLPYPLEEAEVRFIEAGDVRQGDLIRREVILLASHRPTIDELVGVIQEAGLYPAAIDAEPIALLRCYAHQFRREDDRQQCMLYAHVGAANTGVVIARGSEALFVKYIEVSGRHFDEAVARYLEMPLDEAVVLRRRSGDRRREQEDAEVARSLSEATRPVVERLANELSMCLRYHSVTFRGRQLRRVVLSGGEADPALVAALSERIDVPCELGDPFRNFQFQSIGHRRGQWDVATGLALRTLA